MGIVVVLKRSPCQGLWHKLGRQLIDGLHALALSTQHALPVLALCDLEEERLLVVFVTTLGTFGQFDIDTSCSRPIAGAMAGGSNDRRVWWQTGLYRRIELILELRMIRAKVCQELVLVQIMQRGLAGAGACCTMLK